MFWYSCCLTFDYFCHIVFFHLSPKLFLSVRHVYFLESNGLSTPGGHVEFTLDGASKNKPAAGRAQPYMVPGNTTRTTFGKDLYPSPKGSLAFLNPSMFHFAFDPLKDQEREETLKHILASITAVSDNLDGNFLFFVHFFFVLLFFPFSLPPPSFFQCVFLALFQQTTKKPNKKFFFSH